MLKLLYTTLSFLVVFLSASVLLARPIPVRNIKVDVSAKTALQARDLAMNKARQVAFAKLAAEYPEFGINIHEGVPPNNILEGLVIDYEVVGEKMSSVRYIGVFNFNFNDRALKKYLSGSHKLVMPLSDARADVTNRDDSFVDRYIIIPIYISSDTSYLWEESNPWSRYWIAQETKTQGKVGDRQFTVPLGDLRDMTGMTIEDALTSKAQPLSAIRERYQGKPLILILKSLDDGMNSHELQVKALTPSGIPQDSFGPITLQGQKDVSLDDVFKNAVQKSVAIVTGKSDIDMSASIEPSHADQGISMGTPSSIRAIATFNNFQDWQAIRQALNNDSYIDDFDIINLNRQQAEIQIRSHVPSEMLKERLSQMGLRLVYSGGKSRASSTSAVHDPEFIPQRVASPFAPIQTHEDVMEGTEGEEDMDEGQSAQPPEVIE